MPRVTVIVPARNEEASIGACLTSLLSQQAGLELLVANDGSTDGTAAIASRMAEEDHRLRVLAVPEPPRGWMGKNHALAFAAQQARGEWLLFTDADTVHLPGSLESVLEKAGPFDLFSLSPEQEVQTWWEMAVIPRVYHELERLYPFKEIQNAQSDAAAANGQYILIRRAVYERLGGHAAVAGEILEDVALARAAKHAGFRLYFGPGRGWVRTRMYRTFRAMWEGWTKNLYPLYGRRQGRMLEAAVLLLGLDVLPLLAALLWPVFWLPVLARHIWYAAKLKTGGASAFIYLAPGSAILLALLVNSRLHYRSGHTVVWKGREYATWSS